MASRERSKPGAPSREADCQGKLSWGSHRGKRRQRGSRGTAEPESQAKVQVIRAEATKETGRN